MEGWTTGDADGRAARPGWAQLARGHTHLHTGYRPQATGHTPSTHTHDRDASASRSPRVRWGSSAGRATVAAMQPGCAGPTFAARVDPRKPLAQNARYSPATFPADHGYLCDKPHPPAQLYCCLGTCCSMDMLSAHLFRGLFSLRCPLARALPSQHPHRLLVRAHETPPAPPTSYPSMTSTLAIAACARSRLAHSLAPVKPQRPWPTPVPSPRV